MSEKPSTSKPALVETAETADVTALVPVSETPALSPHVERQNNLLERVTGHKYFEGLNLGYLQEIMADMSESEREAFFNQITKYCPAEEENDFLFSSAIAGVDLGEDTPSNDSERVEDPIPVAKLIQKMTDDKPQGSYPGCFVNMQTRETVFQCISPTNASNSVSVPGYILGLQMSNTLFQEGQERPVCWSRDSQIAKTGLLCRDCPQSPTKKDTKCRTQIAIVFLSADFKHLYKIAFASTSLNRGYALYKALSQRAKGAKGVAPFDTVSYLTATNEKNNRGSWVAPNISLTNEQTPSSHVRACRIFAEMFKTYMKALGTSLLALHQTYKKGLESGNPQDTSAAPGGGSVGVDSEFFNTAKKPSVPPASVGDL